ncbi:hypothetical protein [Streptantibioticus ferralitis]|uniref:hypothetical protein n=1 Tax=Streptantibioticus ferralitis TaxID=236510 RepID=UPI0023DA1509|nr:hypothetical protein [Streptantibioticus ferralitis]
MVAAALTAAATYLRSDVRHSLAHRRKNAWRVLEDAARMAAVKDSFTNVHSALAAVERLHEMRRAVFAGRYDDILEASGEEPQRR